MPKLTYAIPAFDATGPMRAPYQILKGFVRAGWDTEIVTLASLENAEIDTAWGCVPVRKIAATSKRQGLIRLASHLIKRSDNSVVLSWVWDWHCFSLMVGNIFLSKPYVICLDGYAHRHPWHGKKWQTQLKLELRYGLNIRNSSLLLAESPAAYQQIRELYPNNLVQQVPICLWEDELKSIEALWNDEGFTPLRAPTILFVGRLVRRKGVHTLLSAFGELAAHYPDWSIEIRGPAPDSAYLGELKQLVAQRGIESRVRFAPSLSGEALFRRYRSAAIFCLPSTGEGMPSAITEAMYFGGAIVAGNSGSIPYQLDNGHAGLLVNYGDVPQLRCHLESLIESRETRMSLMQAARQRMLDEFTWERHFPSVEQQFRTILDGSG